MCLVDGTITPCWSYADHPELWSRKRATTGFNAQLVCLLDGAAVYISDPLAGRTHDATAFTETSVAEIVRNSGGGIGDKGYQGCGIATPRKTPPGGELGKRDKESNAEISALGAPIERLVAHFKSWRIFHTDYRRPTAGIAMRTMPDAHCSSSQLLGVLNSVHRSETAAFTRSFGSARRSSPFRDTQS